MAWVVSSWGNNKPYVRLRPHYTDLGTWLIIKTRKQTTCLNCSKNMASGSLVFGNGWFRHCLECGQKWCHQGIKELEEVQNIIRRNLKELKDNKVKYTTHNLVNQL